MPPVRAIQAVADVKAMAHITGGGLIDNVPRTLPDGVQGGVRADSAGRVPPIMAELVRRGELGHEERYRTLNMGIGYTLIVPFMRKRRKRSRAVPRSTRRRLRIDRGRPTTRPVVVHPART